MVAPSGTYAAIVFPIALSKAAVRALLPQWLIDGTGGQPLLPIPREQLAALGTASSESDETHLLVVQLGWQAGTGIGPRALGLHFHEFKVDVPYVRHPRWAAGRASGTEQPAFSYKLSIGFDSRLLHLAGFVAPGPGRCVYAGAGVLEGMRRALHLSRPPRVTSVPTDGHLRSKELGVHPHTSPSLAAYPPRAPTLAYTAPACVSVAFTARPTTDDAGWDAMRTLLALPWYGGWTGNNVVEFSFDFASAGSTTAAAHARADTPLPPEAYEVASGVLMPDFLGTQATLAPAAAAAAAAEHGLGVISAQAGIAVPPGTKAWRFTASFSGREQPVSSY